MQESKKFPTLTAHKFSQAVPDPTLPKVFEVRGQSWVSYGVDNLFPQNIITPLYNGSAMNRSCIDSKTLFTAGEGLFTTDLSLEYVLKRINSDRESWNDVFYKAAQDFIIYGGYALNIIWNETGDAITDIYHLDFNFIRSGHKDPKTDKVEFFFFSADWSRQKKEIYRAKAFKAFDPAQADLYPNQILYFFQHNPGQIYYPMPSYQGSVTDINIDVMTSSFHWYNLQNGLSPSLFIQMNNGVPPPEERQDIYQELASTFSGVEGAGRFFLSFSTDVDHATTVTPIESANDDYYLTLDQRITSRVLTGHRITSPLLLGIKDTGGSSLSNNKDEILVAANHFQCTVIKPIQKVMLATWNKLMYYYGHDTELYIEPLRLFNEDNQQIGEAQIDAQN